MEPRWKPPRRRGGWPVQKTEELIQIISETVRLLGGMIESEDGDARMDNEGFTLRAETGLATTQAANKLKFVDLQDKQAAAIYAYSSGVTDFVELWTIVQAKAGREKTRLVLHADSADYGGEAMIDMYGLTSTINLDADHIDLATADVLMGALTPDPAAPAANHSILFTRLNGGAKMELCVRFPTGAIQILATEP